jgi:hypothetical protein
VATDTSDGINGTCAVAREIPARRINAFKARPQGSQVAQNICFINSLVDALDRAAKVQQVCGREIRQMQAWLGLRLGHAPPQLFLEDATKKVEAPATVTKTKRAGNPCDPAEQRVCQRPKVVGAGKACSASS